MVIFAQEQLGDVVFIELPEVGADLIEGDEAAVIESVKAAGEIAVPINGTVVAINEDFILRTGSLPTDDKQKQSWGFPSLAVGG